jgi:hypothetical protein
MVSRAFLVGFFLFASTSCTLLVDNKADQCASDDDCTPFPGSACDLTVHICRPLDGPVVGDSSVPDAAGVDACAQPTSLQNACTDAKCKPFDNRSRLKRLPADGGLTPLPPPRDAAVGSNDAASDAPAKVDAASDAGFDAGAKDEVDAKSTTDAGKDVD